MLVELVLRALVFAVLAGLAFVPLERVLPARGTVRTRWTTDLAFATVGHVVARVGAVFFAGAVLSALASLGPTHGVFAAIESPLVRRVANVVVGLVLFELGGYAYHRLAHAAPALYRLHEVHHASESLDWLAAFRQHPVEIWAMMLAQNLPLVLFGLPLWDHAWILVWLRIHTVFVHADVRAPGGVFAAVIATPRFHHRHHDADRAPANFATLFPFLDRLFGTYDDAVAERAGLPYAMPTGFVALMLHPFASLIRTRAPSRRPSTPLLRARPTPR